MNKKQNEEQIRGWIRNIIQEDSRRPSRPLLLEFGWSFVTPDEMADTWIAPFTNVLKVAKVAVKDITSSAKLNLDLLLTFDPDKMEKHHDNWAQRKSSIDAEYTKVMEPINKSLATGDAALVGFMLNPAGFLGAKLVAKGISSVPVAVKELQGAGFDLKMAGALVGASAAGTDGKGSLGGSSDEESGVIGGTLKKLAKLFFIAHHEPSGDVLFEAEKNDAESGGDLETGMEKLLEKMGILGKIQSDAKELATAKIKIINDVMDESRSKFEMLDGLYKAENAQDFKAALEKAKSSGADIGGAGLSAVGKELSTNVDKLLANPETKEAMTNAFLEKSGKKVPEAKDEKNVPDSAEAVSEDDLRKHVEQIVFMQSKQALQEKIYDGVRAMSDAALKVVMEDMPPKEDWALASGSKAGRELIATVKAAVEEIKG